MLGGQQRCPYPYHISRWLMGGWLADYGDVLGGVHKYVCKIDDLHILLIVDILGVLNGTYSVGRGGRTYPCAAGNDPKAEEELKWDKAR